MSSALAFMSRCSMRLASETSSAAVSSGTRPISRRYMRTGSLELALTDRSSRGPAPLDAGSAASPNTSTPSSWSIWSSRSCCSSDRSVASTTSTMRESGMEPISRASSISSRTSSTLVIESSVPTASAVPAEGGAHAPFQVDGPQPPLLVAGGALGGGAAAEHRQLHPVGRLAQLGLADAGVREPDPDREGHVREVLRPRVEVGVPGAEQLEGPPVRLDLEGLGRQRVEEGARRLRQRDGHHEEAPLQDLLGGQVRPREDGRGRRVLPHRLAEPLFEPLGKLKETCRQANPVVFLESVVGKRLQQLGDRLERLLTAPGGGPRPSHA